LAHDQLSRFEEPVRTLLNGLQLEADFRITNGSPPTEIVRVADELKAELLVLGIRGRTGLARVALGSVAERVLETARCSVLVVRNDSEA
jgi:nucleotide-binding universal stress UspA family protein